MKSVSIQISTTIYNKLLFHTARLNKAMQSEWVGSTGCGGGVNSQYLVNVFDVLLRLTDCTIGDRVSDTTAADPRKSSTISKDIT